MEKYRINFTQSKQSILVGWIRFQRSYCIWNSLMFGRLILLAQWRNARDCPWRNSRLPADGNKAHRCFPENKQMHISDAVFRGSCGGSELLIMTFQRPSFAVMISRFHRVEEIMIMASWGECWNMNTHICSVLYFQANTLDLTEMLSHSIRFKTTYYATLQMFKNIELLIVDNKSYMNWAAASVKILFDQT